MLFAFMGTFAYAGFLAAPWFPTWSQDIARFLSLAEIKKGDKFYDLGCGNGKLVFAAAGAGARAVGFEISLLPYLLGLAGSFGVKDARIKYKNFWKADISDADIVYCFLTPKVNPKAREKFEKELRPGTKIIAYTWPIEGWKALKTDIQKGRPTIYLYNKI